MLYMKQKQQKTKEYQFINDFLEIDFFSKYLGNHEFDCTILQEPFTGLGYTDLVAVIWNKDIYSKWQTDRNKLIINDIKILHHLYLNNKYKTITEIMAELGFSKREITDSFTRLDNAGLIKKTHDDKFKTLKKSEIFYIKEIISIEAKLKDWRRALNQAFANIGYSSESYVLFPEKYLTSHMLEEYNKTDIGIIAYKSNFDVVKAAKKKTIPANFNSWLFNEYIGRLL